MKQLVIWAGVTLLAASCSNEESLDSSVNLLNEQALASVTVRVDDFSVSQEEFPDAPTTRAQTVGEYSGLKVLTLAFYKSDGTEQLKVTHMKDGMAEGETFGEFSTSLPLGSYTMVVLGYVLYDDELALTSPTQAEYTVGKPRETFATTQAVNVTNSTTLNLSATLNRIVTKLQVVSTDGRTDNITNVRMTFAAGGKQFSPTSGLATVNTGSVSMVDISTAVGATSSSIGYVFLASDEQTMDVTIETLDSEGNAIFSKTVEDVPFKRNRCTILTGAMYDVSASAMAGSFQVKTEWNTNYNGTF